MCLGLGFVNSIVAGRVFIILRSSLEFMMSSMAGDVEQLKAAQGVEAAPVLHSVMC